MTTIFCAFSSTIFAQYPIDDQIINDAAAMAATGQGLEVYLDKDKPAAKKTEDVYKGGLKETCLTNINLCAKQVNEREHGY